MNKQDQERFIENRKWFNRFMEDILGLFGKIGDTLVASLQMNDPGYYYLKSLSLPSIPTYMMMGQGSDHSSVQVFAVFDPEIINNTESFSKEPSLICVQHGRGDKAVWPEEYGLKVIEMGKIRQEKIVDGMSRGVILGDGETRYLAFQVPFSAFATDADVAKAIQKEIVDRLDKKGL